MGLRRDNPFSSITSLARVNIKLFSCSRIHLPLSKRRMSTGSGNMWLRLSQNLLVAPCPTCGIVLQWCPRQRVLAYHLGLANKEFYASVQVGNIHFFGDTRSADGLAVFTTMTPERLCLGCGQLQRHISPCGSGRNLLDYCCKAQEVASGHSWPQSTMAYQKVCAPHGWFTCRSGGCLNLEYHPLPIGLHGPQFLRRYVYANCWMAATTLVTLM